MKKIIRYVMPLLALSFLVGCNKGGGEKVDYTVNEEEYNKAIHFEGIEYAQATQDFPDTLSNTQVLVRSNLEFSPTVYSNMEAWIEGDKETYKVGSVVFKSEDAYYSCDYESTEGGWDTPKACEAEDLKKPDIIFESTYLSYLEAAKAGYSDFKYNSSTKTYDASFSIVGEDLDVQTFDWSLKFENKKLTNCVLVMSVDLFELNEKTELTLTIDVSYDEIEPETPPML